MKDFKNTESAENKSWQSSEIWQISLDQARPQDVDRYDEANCKRLLREALELLATLLQYKEGKGREGKGEA